MQTPSEGCYVPITDLLWRASTTKPVAVNLVCLLTLIDDFLAGPVSVLHLIILLRLHYGAFQQRYCRCLAFCLPSDWYKTVKPPWHYI